MLQSSITDSRSEKGTLFHAQKYSEVSRMVEEALVANTTETCYQRETPTRGNKR